MNRQTKIIVLVSGALLVVGALGTGIYLLVKKNAAETDTETNPFLTQPNTDEEALTKGYQPLIAPTFNSENELANSLIQLRGKLLYPKTKAEGGWDYTNVRSSPNVNTDQGWWDEGNKLTTIYKGNAIGKVVSDTTTVHNGYSYRWFKLRLLNNVEEHTTGFVRADTVTFKPIL